jgi:hypothetical protein
MKISDLRAKLVEGIQHLEEEATEKAKALFNDLLAELGYGEPDHEILPPAIIPPTGNTAVDTEETGEGETVSQSTNESNSSEGKEDTTSTESKDGEIEANEESTDSPVTDTEEAAPADEQATAGQA